MRTPNKTAGQVKREAAALARQYAREAVSEGAYSISGHFWTLAHKIEAIPIRSAGKPKSS